MSAFSSDYGPHEDAMRAYRDAGTRRAMALPNRGPIRFNADGTLDQAILDAYRAYGFYIFTGVLNQIELDDLRSDVNELLERAPVHKGAEVDIKGRPALGLDNSARNIVWVKPLSDPTGGSVAVGGRHPAKMFEPEAPADAPEHVVQLILGSLQYSDACLRLYGQPQLLSVAAAVNGEDFTPFNEAVWIKHPHLGGSVAWHQDATMQWDHPDFDAGTHGFNFMAQLYPCNAANALWVVPGSHTSKADIKAMCDAAGSDRLPAAVPLVCDAGDVAICNRQAVHGSFANTSPDIRVTINFGFQRRKFILGATGNGIHSPQAVYDADRIFERSKVIAWAIDAREQRFPDETPFDYKPFEGVQDAYRYTSDTRVQLKDYNLLDLGI
jgi:hypothetical protein